MLHAKRVELSLSESNMHSISEGGNIAPKVFGDQQKKVKEMEEGENEEKAKWEAVMPTNVGLPF